MQIDPDKIEKNTQEYMGKKGFVIKTALGKFFLEQNTGMAYISGALTATGLYFALIHKIWWPLLSWVSVYFFLSIIRMIYWYNQVKRSEKELKRIDEELKALNQELQQGKTYFKDLRNKAQKPPEK
ncbi:hypothetical protein ACFL5G_03640 [Candidatus Margulisiibacteriota bacterium]